MATRKSTKTAPDVATIKAYAVLGHPDKKPMLFGSLAKNCKGALSVFGRKSDAVGMTTFKDGSRLKSWKIVPCTITYKVPKK